MKSVLTDADCINYAALLAASSIVSLVVLILVAVPFSLLWLPTPSVYSLTQLPATFGLMVGACLVALTTAFAPLSARNETQSEPYVEASLKRLWMLYGLFHLTVAVQMLFHTSWLGVLLGPLSYVISPVLPYGDFMRGGVALGAMILVGLFGAPAIAWLYWRFSQDSVLSGLKVDSPHARAAVVAAVAAAVLSAVGNLIAFGLLSPSLVSGAGFAFFVMRIPLEAMAALSVISFGACVVACLRLQLKRRLEYVGWMTVFAIIAAALALVSRLFGAAVMTVWSPDHSMSMSQVSPTLLYYVAPDFVAYCVAALIYARGVGARRWAWAAPIS